MRSESKPQILFISSHKLVPGVIRSAALLPELIVAEAVELFAVGVVGGVLVDGVGGHFDGGACGDVLPV